MNKPRFFACLVGAAALLGAVFLVPTPHYVRCSLYLEPRDAAAVYVDSPGKLREIHARPGDWVSAGQPLVTLDNVDIRLAVARLLSEKQQLECKLRSLRQRAFEEDSAALQISEVQKAILSLEEQLAKRQRDSDRLSITAPASGVVISPPRLANNAEEPGRLPDWSGSPLDTKNVCAFLEEGTPVCQVGDPQRLQAIVAVDQADLEFVRPGQQIDVFLEALPAKAYHSRIDQLAQLDMKVSPQSLSSKSGGALPTRRDAGGRDRPLSTTYQASAPLDDSDGLLFVGATGRARIHAGSQTLARRIWRYLCQNFRFNA